MQTALHERVLATSAGRRADEILRTCVHCGFCNATCPTYQLTGDELDGPRGRIYLIKDVLERDEGSAVAQLHLDRCLTCRACETTCPSGVAYGELAEIGRARLEAEVRRGIVTRVIRWWLVQVVPRRRLFAAFARLGNLLRGLLPKALAAAVPRVGVPKPWPQLESQRRVVLLEGCVQATATPEVNVALARVLAGHGIQAIRAGREGCCGSLALHLGAEHQAYTTMVRNVEALFGAAQGCEAILSSASGCGVTIKEYGRLLGGDADLASVLGDDLAEKARWVAAHTRDAAEYLQSLPVSMAPAGRAPRRVAWHAPCTLQHGQRISGMVEPLLNAAGFEVVPVADAHLCCGSAGTYSVLQSSFAGALLDRKLDALMAAAPDVIATANVGCALHLAGRATVPVVHWIELLEGEPEDA